MNCVFCQTRPAAPNYFNHKSLGVLDWCNVCRTAHGIVHTSIDDSKNSIQKATKEECESALKQMARAKDKRKTLIKHLQARLKAVTSGREGRLQAIAERMDRAMAWIRSLATGEFTRVELSNNIGCTRSEGEYVIYSLKLKGLIEDVNAKTPRIYGLVGRPAKPAPAPVPEIDERSDKEKAYLQFRAALNILPVESLASRFTNRGELTH